MPDIPLRPTADPQWEELHHAADAKEAGLVHALRLAFAALVGRAILLRVREALRFRDAESVMQAVPIADLMALQSTFESILERAALDGAKVGLETDILLRLGSNRGLPAEELARWARTQSAALVVDITEETRRALRGILAQALRDGTSPRQAALLVENVIGLNRQQAAAVLRRWEALSVVRDAQRWAITQRYAARLLRHRAQVIARHELLQAANAGRRAVWLQNVAEGVILPDRWEREWVAIVPSDGRTCPTCVELDGERAPIGAPYGNGMPGPPAHVICRCVEKLVRR